MDLCNLYNIANNEHIKIYNYYIDDSKGLFINVNNINAIALNYKNIQNSCDEKCALCEELRSLLYGCNLFCIL